MARAHIVLLNGVTSSGKTSIAREMQELSDENYYHVSLDMFEQMANIKYRIRDYFRELNDCASAMYVTIRELAALGKNVILDTVLLDIPEFPRLYERLTETCAGVDLYNIRVICSLDECERRNGERGDRTAGQSRWHSERMLEIPYFHTVDTTEKSARECAEDILARIDERRAP